MSIRILLADDDDALRRVIQYKLEQEGYEVSTVNDGEKALDELKSGQFDLVLSDIKMPKLTGVQLLEQVKKIQPSLEVILMTAFADVSQAVRA
ncbi:MAG: sigma-54-dependent Fis family transcriptional regulator, partial [Candidatus Zixiibacteriota bacterium]